MRWRCIGELTDFVTSTTSPAGVRTATDQTDGPRIITPSRTAWPPYETLTLRPHVMQHPRCGPKGDMLPLVEQLLTSCPTRS